MILSAGTLPRQLYIESTNRCNSLCHQCPLTLLPQEPLRDMTLDEFTTIIDQVPHLERLVLHGLGEPLLNRDITVMVAYAKRRGAHVLFNSNAILLTPALEEALIESGLDEFRISIDGASPEMYARVRGVDKLPIVVRNVRRFAETRWRLGATHPALSIWFTAMRTNLPELPQLIELAGQIGIEEVYVQRLVYFESGLACGEEALFRRAQAEELEILACCTERSRELGIQFRAAGAATPLASVQPTLGERPWSGCWRPTTLTYITVNGNCLSCCFAPFGHWSYSSVTLGNVFEEPLADIWQGERYQAFRAAFASDHPPEQCGNCGTKWSL